MTSPGIKRPLECETESQTTGLSASGTSPKDATGGEGGGEIDQDEAIKVESMDGSNSSMSTNNNISTNGSKRRCTTNNNFLSANNQQSTLASSADSELQQANQLANCEVENINNTSSDSLFKDSSSSLSSLSDNVANLIKDELQQACLQNESQTFEPPILNASQTQSICEKLVRQRETKLRDEYNKILARKLAEQYDTFAKQNYINSTVDPSRRMPASAVSTTTLATAPTTTVASPSLNSTPMNPFGAALQMQRSGQPQSVVTTSAPNSINDSHHMSYNSYQQQAAAAAAAAAAAIQHHHHQRVGHQQQQQHLSVQHRMTPNSMGQMNPALAGSIIPFGPVLLTSNLDEELAVPEALFTLFGVFGDVVRVKILFNKKDNALIQMADATQAQVAQSYLDKQRIFGKIIRVTRSKHLLVQMPREGNQSDAGLTKDFTNSPLHRFKIPGSRNYLNIYPPSNTLHISNIPASVDEKDLQKAFKKECGFEFTSFKFFPKERKMALMKFASTENATIALIKMHNFQISEENNLRVSFSKTSI